MYQAARFLQIFALKTAQREFSFYYYRYYILEHKEDIEHKKGEYQYNSPA